MWNSSRRVRSSHFDLEGGWTGSSRGHFGILSRVLRRVFAYLNDPLSTYAAVPYRRVLFDRRGFRNAIALRSELYLADKGLGPDEQPVADAA